jgi:hypothetical protein
MSEQKQGTTSKQQSQMEGPAAYAPHGEGEKKDIKSTDKQKQGGAGRPQTSKLEAEKQGGIGGP